MKRFLRNSNLLATSVVIKILAVPSLNFSKDSILSYWFIFPWSGTDLNPSSTNIRWINCTFLFRGT